MKKLISLAAIASLFIISQVSAVTWDFTGHSGEQASSFDIFDTTGAQFLTVSGNANVFWGAKGLGLKSGLNNQIDNKNVDDVLKLDFLTSIFVRSFTIKGQDGNDRVWTKVDGGSWTNSGIVANNTPVAVDQNASVMKFSQGRSSVGQQGYYLSSITVPDTGSTLALLGLGLLGMAFARRRFSK